jgi:hypothetical protein
MVARPAPIGVVVGLACAIIGAPDLRVAAQRQVFRAGTDVVSVDFSARGFDGRATTDLKREELTLRVDGKPREIVLAETVDRGQSIPLANAPEIRTVDGSRKLVGTNFYLAVGPMAPEVGLVAVKAAEQFLDTLIPTDRVALVTFPGARSVVELTSDSSRIRAELPLTIGFSHTVVNGPHAGWPEFLASLGKEPGRKTVVFIDELNGPQEIEAKEQASLADVCVYVIQPLHFTAAAGEAAPRSAYRPDNPSLVNLANLTGGLLPSDGSHGSDL